MGMSKIFAAPGVSSHKLTAADEPLWQQIQDASREILDAAMALVNDPTFKSRLDHAQGTAKEVGLEGAVKRFSALTKPK